MMFDEPENEMPPVAATTEGVSTSVEAVYRRCIGKPDAKCNKRLPDKTDKEQARKPAGSLPGFTGEPDWELARYEGNLVAGERTFHGKRFFELRLWAGEHGDKPTKKGVTLPPENVRDLAIALMSYADRLDGKAQG